MDLCKRPIPRNGKLTEKSRVMISHHFCIPGLGESTYLVVTKDLRNKSCKCHRKKYHGLHGYHDNYIRLGCFPGTI